MAYDPESQKRMLESFKAMQLAAKKTSVALQVAMAKMSAAFEMASLDEIERFDQFHFRED